MGKRSSPRPPEAGGASGLRLLPSPPPELYLARKRGRTSAGRARVVVVDGHPLVEEWLATLLSRETDLVLAGRVEEVADAAPLVARLRPNLVLLEIAKDIPRGMEVVRTLKAKFPRLRILVFSSCDETAHAAPALRAGALGFVSKAATGPTLMRAIREVLADGIYLSREMITCLTALVPGNPPPPSTGLEALLSERELQVFGFLGEGLRPTEISRRIKLSVKTVESYTARIREKLGLPDSRALFQTAVKWSKECDGKNSAGVSSHK